MSHPNGNPSLHDKQNNNSGQLNPTTVGELAAVTHIEIELDEITETYSLVDAYSPMRFTLVEGFTTFRSALLYLYQLYREFPEIEPRYIDYLRNYGAE